MTTSQKTHADEACQLSPAAIARIAEIRAELASPERARRRRALEAVADARESIVVRRRHGVLSREGKEQTLRDAFERLRLADLHDVQDARDQLNAMWVMPV